MRRALAPRTCPSRELGPSPRTRTLMRKTSALHFARAYGLGLLVMAAMVLATGCGISWWIGPKPPAPIEYVYVQLDGAVSPPAPPAPESNGHHIKGVYDAGYEAGMPPWFLATGTSGTVTVPSGAYATGVYCVAATDAGAATLTITPDGPSSQGLINPQINAPISIPAGVPFNLGNSLLNGTPRQVGAGTMGPLQLGPGSVFVFAGTATFVVTMYWYGGN